MKSKERRRLVKVFDGVLTKQLLSYCTLRMVVGRVKALECPFKKGNKGGTANLSSLFWDRDFFYVGKATFILYFELLTF